MAVYTLRSTWRFTDGRGGTVVTAARITAETTAGAIADAKAAPDPDLPVTLQTMHLIDPSGRVVWSLKGPNAPLPTAAGE